MPINIVAAPRPISVSSKVKLHLIFIVILAIIIFFIHINLYEYGFDDAFIHFRVARNLLDLGTPYFNINEAIKVSTSSAWTIFLAFVLSISRVLGAEKSLPLIVALLNVAFTFLGMLVYTKIIHLLYKGTKTRYLDVVFQVSFIALMAPSSIGLMETPLAMLIAGIGIYLLLLNRHECFILFALAAYIRIELLILIFLGVFHLLIHKKIRGAETLLFTTIGLAPFVIYDLYFFHTILPHSITAKSIIYSITSAETMGRIILLSFPLNSLITNSLTTFIINLILLFGFIYFAIKTTIIQWFARNRETTTLLFTTWSILIISLYIWKRVLLFEWYIPLYTIPLITALIVSIGTTKASQKSLPTALLVGLFLICLISLGQTTYAGISYPANFSLFESGSRVKTYRKVAEILNSEYPNATLLSSEIGGLGYEFKGKILDAAGLASSDALKYHPMKIPEERERGDLGAIPPEYVEEKMPEIIVSYDVFGTALLNSNVSGKYNIIAIPAYLPEDGKYSSTGLIWGSKYLRVYIRKDLPISDKLRSLSDENK